MIRFEYEPALVEQAVRLAVIHDPAMERALHAEIDPLYAIPDPQRRDPAFAQCFAKAFRALELDRIVPALLEERPLVVSLVDGCKVCRAGRWSGQSAELFVRPAETDGAPKRRTLVVSVCPEALVHPDRAASLLRRELLHVSDMLDERFGYRPADLEGLSRLQQPTRDRYRVLWDVYVESRLRREGRVDDEGGAGLWPAFARAFTTDGKAPPPEMFEGLLALPAATHAAVFRAASDPCRLSALAGDDRVESIVCAGAAERPLLAAKA